jgi:hypothetical protein
MKKIVASVGLVALGASALQTASAQALVGPDASKPWSVSATIRGFYDDNPGTVANDVSVDDRESFGFEVTPSAALAWSLQQTTINLGFLYSLRYYDTKPPGSAEHADQVFTFSAGVTHNFSDSLHLRASDSFVIGQEPDLLRSGETYSTFQRVSGDNIRNHASLGLDAQLSPVIGLGVGYDNAFYDYDDEGYDFTSGYPSISGLLDRMEHRVHLEGLYSLTPETKLLLGYRYMQINYSGDEVIGAYFDPNGFPAAVYSDSRDSREHTLYVGAQHSFSPALSGAARVGVSYTDYFNDDNADETYTPYVDASLKYTYAPDSFVQGGVSYDRNATDVIGVYNDGEFTLDAQSAVFFLNLTHRLDARLFASIIGQFQNSAFNGGYYDEDAEQYYMIGLNLEYKFNQYFAAHIGYNYDRLESDLGRTFDRNRVYIGVTASY